MKKILFMQIKGNSLGGVWFVNKMLAEEFIKRGYEVTFINVRNCSNIKNECNSKINVITINEKDKWEILHISDLMNNIKKLKINSLFKNVLTFIKEHIRLSKDFKITKEKIREINPDYIITSHYQLLNAIDKDFLSRCINVHHSSYDVLKTEKKNYKTLKKYDGKVINAWLCKTAEDKAIKDGFTKNNYIYNPIKFTSKDISNVNEYKRLVTISRLSSDQKRIDLMIKLCDKVLKKNKDWTLELYGPGELDQNSMDIINKNKRIKLMGQVDDVKEVLLKSSIYLSTSSFEGFSLSILESFECGVPVVAYKYGESCLEQIPDGCGYVIDFDNEKEFIYNLEKLMTDSDKLNQYSRQCKHFAKQFNIDIIADEWEKLFKEMSE